jgi:hypothetical protein
MKERVLALASQGHKAPTIAKELQKENLKYLRVGMHKFSCDFEDWTDLEESRVRVTF